jgi:murein DD-endopeptidase MepM/ murein hydrolase activator NlpD
VQFAYPGTRLRALTHRRPTTPIEQIPEHAKPSETGLPALNGRSVRSLTRIEMIRTVKWNVALATGTFVVALAAGYGVPAAAHAVEEAATPVIPLQTMTVSAQVTAQPVAARDGYQVTVPPPLVWPVDPSIQVISGFGPREQACAACSSMHMGVDIGAAPGTQIGSMAAGRVVETDNPGYSALGVHATIEHVVDGQVILTRYAHMQQGSLAVQPGDVVYPGQPLGRVGQTGVATHPHLHFELLLGGSSPVDGWSWLHSKLG